MIFSGLDGYDSEEVINVPLDYDFFVDLLLHVQSENINQESEGDL